MHDQDNATAPQNTALTSKHKTISLNMLWLMFALFMVIFVANLFCNLAMPPVSRAWLALSIWAIALSALLLWKHGLPQPKKIGVSVILAVLACAGFGTARGGLLNIALSFFLTLIASLAMFSTQAAFPGSGLAVLGGKRRGGVALSIILGLAVGAAWGVLNYFLMVGQSGVPHFQLSLPVALRALNPAIMEEIGCRAIFFCFCLSAVNGRLLTKKAKFTCWFMMILPHAIVHTPDAFIAQGLISGIINTFGLALLFGLPFAILQRKRDITAAMIAHGLVDFIRFCFFGLPM